MFSRCPCLGPVIAALALAAAPVTAESLRIDVASTFPQTMPILGEVSQNLPDRIARLTGGELEMVFHAPNELVPAAETVNAVSSGQVAAAWAGAGWFAGRDSAFNMFSSVPFGPNIDEYLAWMFGGGGLELSREMFSEHGVHNIPCGIIPPEASGWFSSEINSVEDLQGLRMRFFGLGARVMEKHGVETSQLAPSEILAALEEGRIDATEFSLPAMDRPLGFSRVMKYYYFPGWHQQATLFDLYVNLDVWAAMSDRDQAAIEAACGAVMRDMIAEGEARQWEAMQALQEEGVQLRRWSPEILVSFEAAWQEVVAEEAAANPNFERVWASYSEFRENYAIWRYFSFLQ